MGFTLMYKRISYSLVVTLMLKVGTYMPLFFTLMLSFIKVEDEAKSLAAKEERVSAPAARREAPKSRMRSAGDSRVRREVRGRHGRGARPPRRARRRIRRTCVRMGGP